MTDTILLRSPPHLFEQSKTIVTKDTPDRSSETWRTCKTCGLVKITVHGNAGQSWREWRVGEGQFMGEAPPCVPSSVPSTEGNKAT